MWTTRFVHADGLGSVRAITDETGTVVDTRGYEAFGTKNVEAGSETLAYGFAGEPLDSTSKLAYHRARWMDSRVGRFTGMDAVDGDQQRPISLQKYVYASDEPSDRIDPSGNDDLVSLGVAVTIIGIGATLAGCTPKGITTQDSGVDAATKTRLPNSTAHVSRCVQNLFAPYLTPYPIPYDRVTIWYVNPGDSRLHGNDGEELSYGDKPNIQYQIYWTLKPSLTLDTMSTDSLALLGHELFHVEQELRLGGKIGFEDQQKYRDIFEGGARDFQNFIAAQYAGQTPCPHGVDP
jgi:RHS repeat-associated protein